MIRIEEARRRILENLKPLAPERTALLEATGRVLGEEIIAGRDIPPYDHAAMDGFALRVADTQEAARNRPVSLEIGETVPAGSLPVQPVEAGRATRIMTGALIPSGADAVIRIEEVRLVGDRIDLFRAVRAGEAIRRGGEILRRGEKVLLGGDILRPSSVGLLAALGIGAVAVHRRPQVAIVATGDELTELGEPPAPGRIVGSNSYALAALTKDAGGIPWRFGIARDRREALTAKFRAVKEADLILSTGGTALGDYDLIKPILKETGNHLDFWQVAMTPGRFCLFGVFEGTPVIGLSGNPFAAQVGFEQFVRPALLKMQGHRCLYRRTIRACLTRDLQKRPGLGAFSEALVSRERDQLRVTPLGKRPIAPPSGMPFARGLIVLPAETTGARKGEIVDIQLLDDGLEWTTEPGG